MMDANRSGDPVSVYDCFTFFNEFDLLDIRLAELDPVVDRFVLVEANRTHTGRPKPLYFRERQDRYRAWGDRLAAFVVDDLPPYAGDPWPLEREQRRRCGDFLRTLGCRDDDLVLLSDVDEIPRAASLPAVIDMVRRRGVAILVQRLQRFYLNNITDDDENFCDWCGTVAFRYSELARHDAARIRGYWCSGGQFARHASWRRRRRCVPGAGWHFTSMGGPHLLNYKLQSFAHSDLGDPAVAPVGTAWAHGAESAGLDAEEPACRPFRGTCACGCTWKGRPQRYVTPGDHEFEALLDSLPAVVRERRAELTRLFRRPPHAPGPG